MKNRILHLPELNTFIKKSFGSIKEKKQVVIPITLVLCICLVLVFVRSFFRPVKKYVPVEKTIWTAYEEKFEKVNAVQKKIKFVQQEDFAEIKNRGSFAGAIPTAVAVVSLRKDFNLQLKEETSDPYRKTFILKKTAYVPSIKCSFDQGKNTPFITDPQLTVAIGKAAELPEESRALPVEGLYAGEKGYSLEEFTSAELFLLEEKKASLIESLLNSVFYAESHDGKDSSLTEGEESLPLESPSISSDGGTESSETVFIASAGDIMVARGVQDILLKEGGVEKVFRDTLPVLRSNDLTIGNLEGVVTDLTKNAVKTYTFKFKKPVLEPLKNAGFNYFMQTNNHCYDYGEDGFKDTLKALAEYGIPSSGIGYNDEEAKQFYYTQLKGQKIAVISCGAYPVEQSGFNGEKTASATEDRAGILWQSDELLESVKTQREDGNLVVVNVHGGEEYRFKPNKKQRDFYEKLIENGASVVFGSHPHVLQPSQWYKDGFIVYSLGNFVFPGMDGMNGATDSEIVRLGFYEGKLLYVEQYPCVLEGTSVRRK